MSIQGEIARISGSVAAAYTAVEAKGGTLPEIQNSANLPDAILGIPAGKYILDITFESVFLEQTYTVNGPDGEIYTGIVPDSLREFVAVNQGGAEYTVASTDSSGQKYSASVLTGSAFGIYSVELKGTAHIYGVTWDGTAATKWARTDDAAGFTDPVPYVLGATKYGSPFDNLMPWAGMTIEERAGGTMVKIPKFWYQLYQNTEGVPSSGITIRIADKPVEGFHTSPAHMDRGDGHGERDVVYVGRYHCGPDYKSKTGVLAKNSVTRETARAECHKLGADIWQMDLAARFTIGLLYLVEFADWNSQEKIGCGCGNGAAESMGATDGMPYHTGTMQSTRTAYGVGVQYRWIEGLWDTVYDWIDGCYYNSDGLNVILNPASFSDFANGTLVGKPSNGYPTVMDTAVVGNTQWMYPTTSNGNGTACISDYFGFKDSSPCLYCGGSYFNRDSYFGLFYVYYASASYLAVIISCRLLELPNNV